MNGAHDLGGMHGFGAINPDPDEPLFHAEWELRCFALTLAAGFTGEWNIDASRFAREQMAPAEYLSTGYYVHLLHGLEYLLLDRTMATPPIAMGIKAMNESLEAQGGYALLRPQDIIADDPEVKRKRNVFLKEKAESMRASREGQ